MVEVANMDETPRDDGHEDVATPDPRGHAPRGEGLSDSRSDNDADDPDEEVAEADEAAVKREIGEITDFLAGLGKDDIRSSNWFEKLLEFSLRAYTEKIDAEYFQRKYPGLPADAVVAERIRIGARFAALEGGLSAAAYTGAVAATVGTGGGASPLTIPAAALTLSVDLAFLSRLQLRLAYDIATLYRVPLDLTDPTDLWKLIRVAFTIKTGEVAREGVIKVVPPLLRPLIKAFYKGPVLAAARGLPVVGKYLLQRNVIKFALPAVGIPLATLLNRYTTLIAGRHAREIFRNEARIREEALRMIASTDADEALPWIVWAAIVADRKIAEDETLLMHQILTGLRSRGVQVSDALAELIEVDLDHVWAVVGGSGAGADSLFEAAQRTALIDGDINKPERDFLDKLRSTLPTQL